MSEIWKVFSKAELQDLIGNSTLDRLVQLIPALSANVEPDSIYYADTLAKIFDAFAGPDAIAQASFRKRFLNHLTPEQVDDLINATGVKAKGTFDEKIQKLAAKGWKDESFCAAFIDSLKLPASMMPAPDVDIDYRQTLEAVEDPYKVLKDYQFGVYQQSFERSQIPNSRFVVQMPTGSGKTRTAMELITAYFNSMPEPKAIVWLAHSEELCEKP